jgi:hypothetical protein
LLFYADSELQNQKVKNQKRIQFNSDEYFKLLKDKPETSQFLALGQNVRFYYENTYKKECEFHGWGIMQFSIWYEEYKYNKTQPLIV